MKRVLFVLISCVLIFNLVACSSKGANTNQMSDTTKDVESTEEPINNKSSESNNTSNNEEKAKILFTQTHNNNSFMSYMGEIFVETAEKSGFEVNHLTADSDEATQLSQIEQAIASGEYVGIIVDATGEGITQGFKEAQEAGIKTMTLHEGIKDNTYVDAIVACSLAETGYEAIRLEREQLGSGFNLAIVNGSEGHGATVAIREGYDRALSEFPDINVVFDGAGNWNAEDAMALTESWFSSDKQIDGIVCMNDGMATGVRQVMKDNGFLGKIPIYSNDCEIDTLQAIEDGEQSGSFDMNAQAQCEAAVDLMKKLLSGEELEEKEIYVDPLLVTIDNLEEYRASHSGTY